MTNFDARRYTIIIKLITDDEGEHYEALVAELPDLVEYAETYDRAYSLAVEAIGSLHEAAEEQGRQFPAPLPSQAMPEYSGRVTLRMGKSLHAQASQLADRDGVSLNSWIVEAIATRVGSGNLAVGAPLNMYPADYAIALMPMQPYIAGNFRVTQDSSVVMIGPYLELKGRQEQGIISSNQQIAVGGYLATLQ